MPDILKQFAIPIEAVACRLLNGKELFIYNDVGFVITNLKWDVPIQEFNLISRDLLLRFDQKSVGDYVLSGAGKIIRELGMRLKKLEEQ